MDKSGPDLWTFCPAGSLSFMVSSVITAALFSFTETTTDTKRKRKTSVNVELLQNSAFGFLRILSNSNNSLIVTIFYFENLPELTCFSGGISKWFLKNIDFAYSNFLHLSTWSVSNSDANDKISKMKPDHIDMLTVVVAHPLSPLFRVALVLLCHTVGHLISGHWQLFQLLAELAANVQHGQLPWWIWCT